MVPDGLPPLIVLCGPTASGKTGLALEVAEHWPVEIISADSRQVYRGLDIGTAKATPEERARVTHHLIDVVEPDQDFTAADFLRLGTEAALEVSRRGRLPMVVGGTGLYIRALTQGLVPAPAADPGLRTSLMDLEGRGGEGTLHRRLKEVDPVLAARLAPRDLVRIVRALEVHSRTGRPFSELQAQHAFGGRPFRTLVVGLTTDRELLYRRIDERVEKMMADGLLREVKDLLAKGFSPGCKGLRTIGYQELIAYLEGKCPLTDAVELIQRNSRRYAKRQLTWFRKEKSLIWLDSSTESDRILALIENFMHRKRSGHG